MTKESIPARLARAGQKALSRKERGKIFLVIAGLDPAIHSAGASSC
jgi:hypothetical protein